MVTDTEGIVLRQTKTVGGRRMITLFSKKYGKISVGSSITEGGKNKSALAIRPFTNGRYELFKSRESYNLNNGQVLRSFYKIGEDLDKYMAASYVLELTEKVLPDELPQPRVYALLLEFLEGLEKREKKHDTLVMAYVVKLLDILGNMPHLENCVCCGSENTGRYFCVSEGGIICDKCAERLGSDDNRALIYVTNFGIVNILKYFQKNHLSAFEKLALDNKVLERLQIIMKSYLAYHLDVKELKSEDLLRAGLI